MGVCVPALFGLFVCVPARAREHEDELKFFEPGTRACQRRLQSPICAKTSKSQRNEIERKLTLKPQMRMNEERRTERRTPEGLLVFWGVLRLDR